VALIEVAPSITWLLVSTSPVEVSTIPVPAALPPWYPRVVTTSTMPGSTLAAICGVVSVVAAVASVAASPPMTIPAAATAAPAIRAWCRHDRRPRPSPWPGYSPGPSGPPGRPGPSGPATHSPLL
jgi:hypothetical protein